MLMKKEGLERYTKGWRKTQVNDVKIGKRRRILGKSAQRGMVMMMRKYNSSFGRRGRRGRKGDR